MSDGIWQIYRTNGGDDGILAGTFDGLSAAARHIIEAEGLSQQSLTFHVHVTAKPASDHFALNYLEYKGRHAFYVITRQGVARRH